MFSFLSPNSLTCGGLLPWQSLIVALETTTDEISAVYGLVSSIVLAPVYALTGRECPVIVL